MGAVKRYQARAFYAGVPYDRWIITDGRVPVDERPGLHPEQMQHVVATELPMADAIALAEQMNRQVEREREQGAR